MLATTDVDLVSICAPPPLHAPLVTTALRAGCHVLCEPSAATDPADLARLSALATIEHRVLTYAFPYRHLTETRTARGIVDAGEIGEIHEIQLGAPGRREAVPEECCAGWTKEGGGGLRPLGGRPVESAGRDRPGSADGAPEPADAPEPIGAAGCRLDRPPTATEGLAGPARTADGPEGRFWVAGDVDRASWAVGDADRESRTAGNAYRASWAVDEVYDRPRSAAGTHPRHLTPADCGALTDIGFHLLDLAMWITGFPEPVEMLWTTSDAAPATAENADGRAAQPQAAQAPGRQRVGAQRGTDAADARAARAVAREHPDARPIPPAERPATGLVATPGTGPLGPSGTALIRCCDGMSLSLTPSHGTAYTTAHDTACTTARGTPYATTSRGTAYAADPPDEQPVRVRLVGDRGALEIFPLLLSHPNRSAPGHTLPPLPGRPRDLQLARRRQIAAFVDACLGRGPAPVTAAEALHVQKIADSLHRTAHATTAHGEPDARGRSTVLGQPSPHEAAPTTLDDPVQEASRA